MQLEREDLLKLLRENEFRILFQRLREILLSRRNSSGLIDALILLEARYETYSENFISGLLSQEQANIELASIRRSALDIINIISASISETNPPREGEKSEVSTTNPNEDIPKLPPILKATLPWSIPFLLTVTAIIWGTAAHKNIQVLFQAEADYLTFRAKDGWIQEDFIYLKSLIIENLYSYMDINDTLKRAPWEPFDLEINGDIVQIDNSILLRPGSIINFFLEKGELRMSMQNDSLTGSAHIQNAEVLVEDLDFESNTSDSIGLTLNFQTISGTALWLTLCEDCEISFKNLSIDSLDLIKHIQIDPPKFRSSILRGKIHIKGFPEPQPIEPGMFLLPRIGSEGIFSLKINGDSMNLTFEGKLEEAKLGYEHSEKSILPSRLEYFYYASPVHFFVYVFLFLLISYVTLRIGQYAIKEKIK